MYVVPELTEVVVGGRLYVASKTPSNVDLNFACGKYYSEPAEMLAGMRYGVSASSGQSG